MEWLWKLEKFDGSGDIPEEEEEALLMHADQEEGVIRRCSGERSEDGRPVVLHELEGLVTREFSGVWGRDLVTQVEVTNDAVQ